MLEQWKRHSPRFKFSTAPPENNSPTDAVASLHVLAGWMLQRYTSALINESGCSGLESVRAAEMHSINIKTHQSKYFLFNTRRAWSFYTETVFAFLLFSFFNCIYAGNAFFLSVPAPCHLVNVQSLLCGCFLSHIIQTVLRFVHKLMISFPNVCRLWLCRTCAA